MTVSSLIFDENSFEKDFNFNKILFRHSISILCLCPYSKPIVYTSSYSESAHSKHMVES